MELCPKKHVGGDPNLHKQKFCSWLVKCVGRVSLFVVGFFCFCFFKQAICAHGKRGFFLFGRFCSTSLEEKGKRESVYRVGDVHLFYGTQMKFIVVLKITRGRCK